MPISPRRLQKALAQAARNGDVEAFRRLDMAGELQAVVNDGDSTGTTPLMMVSKNGNCNAARVLLGADADVQAADRFGCTALHYARHEMATCRLWRC